MESVIVKGGEGVSMLRNPDIAHQCYYRKLIEMMGTGIPRMIQDSKEHGFDIPIFEIKDQIVRVSFPNIHYLRAEQPHQSATDLMAHFEGVIEGVIEGVGKEIKEKLASILCILNEQVKRLKDAGLIKYSGSSKSGGYFLSDSLVRE